MTHEEIQHGEIAEAYLRGRLSESDRAAFEDHCFACDECFADVQMRSKFADGVRTAADTGVLPEATEVAEVYPFRWAFWLPAVGCAMLGVLCGWALLVERPRLQAEAARERLAAEAGQIRVTEIERDLEGAKLATMRASAPQSNLPLLMLTASRAGAAAAITLPSSASELAFWLEPAPSPSGSAYRLEISGPGALGGKTIDGLQRNAYGALATSIPAAGLTQGTYHARLYLNAKAGLQLAGDYLFEIRR